MFNGGEFSKILDEIFEKDEKEKEKAIKIYCKIWEYLENITLQNLKYKRAFEILKRTGLRIVEYDADEYSQYLMFTKGIDTDVEPEEAELLEELMDNENS